MRESRGNLYGTRSCVQFEELCRVLCTVDEICAFFDCTVASLDDWCNEVYGHDFDDVYSFYRGRGLMELAQSFNKLKK